MGKFKVGDKVVRTSVFSGGPHFKGMYIGDTDVVVAVAYGSIIGAVGLESFVGGHYCQCLELYQEEISDVVINQNVRLIIQGKAVVLIDENGNKGLARCHPSDTFNFDIAIPLVVERLLEAQRGGGDNGDDF